MLQRYLNDAIEVSNSTACPQENGSISNTPSVTTTASSKESISQTAKPTSTSTTSVTSMPASSSRLYWPPAMIPPPPPPSLFPWLPIPSVLHYMNNSAVAAASAAGNSVLDINPGFFLL